MFGKQDRSSSSSGFRLVPAETPANPDAKSSPRFGPKDGQWCVLRAEPASVRIATVKEIVQSSEDFEPFRDPLRGIDVPKSKIGR